MQEEDVVVDNCPTLTEVNQITEQQTVQWDEDEPAKSPLEVLSFPVDQNTRIEGETEHEGNDGTEGQRELDWIEQQPDGSSRQNISQLGLLWTFKETLEIIEIIEIIEIVSSVGVTTEHEAGGHDRTDGEGADSRQEE